MQGIVEGDNYKLSVANNVLRLEVWERRDLSFERGAELAEEIGRHIVTEVRRPGIIGVLIDFRKAPVVWGPVTEAAIGRFMMSVVDAKRRLAAVSTDAVQRFQVENVVRDCAPGRGLMFDNLEAALQWLTA